MAATIKLGNLILLSGDIGSGKTTFVRGFAKGLGADVNDVHSPTFTVENIYEGEIEIHHYDFYRLLEVDLEEFGIYEALERGVAVVEWPEKSGELVGDINVSIEYGLESDRIIHITKNADICA